MLLLLCVYVTARSFDEVIIGEQTMQDESRQDEAGARLEVTGMLERTDQPRGRILGGHQGWTRR